MISFILARLGWISPSFFSCLILSGVVEFAFLYVLLGKRIGLF